MIREGGGGGSKMGVAMRKSTRLVLVSVVLGLAALGAVSLTASAQQGACPPGTTNPAYCQNAIVGTNGNDLLRGTNGDDVIICRGGHDIVFALAGNDRILCDTNGTTSSAGAFASAVNAAAGRDDSINCGTGNDVAQAGKGNDRIVC